MMQNAQTYRPSQSSEKTPLDIDGFRQKHFHQWVLQDGMGHCQTCSGWAFFGLVAFHEKVLCIAATAAGKFYYSKPSLSLLQTAIHLHTRKWKSPEALLETLLDLAAADPDFFWTLPHAPIPHYLKLWDDDEYTHLLPMLVAQLARPFGATGIERLVDRTVYVQRLLDLNGALFRWMDTDILRFLEKEDTDARLHHYCFIHSSPDPETRRLRMQSPLQSPIGRIYYEPLKMEF